MFKEFPSFLVKACVKEYYRFEGLDALLGFKEFPSFLFKAFCLRIPIFR